uniref:Uncharacterized protein n=1 Tax=Solanum tuberosum TaxID=4113 RepID=M1C7M1_SOLTU
MTGMNNFLCLLLDPTIRFVGGGPFDNHNRLYNWITHGPLAISGDTEKAAKSKKKLVCNQHYGGA